MKNKSINMSSKKRYKPRKCEYPDCSKKKVVRTRKYKGKHYCFNCYQKLITKIGSFYGIDLEKALSKTYEINGYESKEGIFGYKTFPKVLIGHRFKLILVKGGNKK